MFALPLLADFLAHGQGGPFKPTPQNAWIMDGLRIAVREGTLPRRQGTLIGYRNTLDLIGSRYEIAVYIHVALSTQIEQTRAMFEEASRGTGVSSMLRADILLPYYRRGTKEFRPELRNLGVTDEDVASALAQLGSLVERLNRSATPRQRLFRDVPPTHWAAKAVGDLRALGLLDGYPSGDFHG